jgi:cyclohexyl-isocyanide hydratase
MTQTKTTRIGMLVFPKITALDILGPFEVLARTPNCSAQLVWKDTSPVQGDTGLRLLPDVDFAHAPQFDVIVVPGGPGQTDLMEDEEVLQFLRTQAAGAELVTSICTGSLLLAAAGLLTGYKSTCHWLSIDQLEQFGVQTVPERVVVDRNRITGAGVTSGLDFAFTVVATLRGEDVAKSIQLMMEYDPAPPFDSGHPRVAAPSLVAQVRKSASAMLDRRRAVSARVAQRLRSTSA